MQMFGIDTSKWNGDFNLQSAVSNDGVRFVVIKAGGSDDGLYIDSQFKNTYQKCKALGIPCGAYWYSAATSKAEAITEANYLIGKIQGMQFELPIYFDFEDKKQSNLSAAQSQAIVLAWLEQMYANKWYAGIYSFYAWFTEKLDSAKVCSYPVWLAYWTNSKPSFKYDYGMWQKGSQTIAGATTDINYLYKDYTSIIKNGGYNGYMAPTPTPAKQTFKDVPPTRSDYKAIEWMAKTGQMKGYSDGTFRPDEPLTRGQYAMVEWRNAGRPEV